MPNYKINYSKDYLEHYGVRGMKWGVWNEETKARYSSMKASVKKNVDAAFTPGIKGGKDKPNQSPAEKAFKDAGKAVDSAGNIARTLSDINRGKRRKEYDKDLSKMSNKEIQDAVNRMNLEKQYRNLKEEDVSDGFRVADDILGVVGDVLVIGGSVAGMITAGYYLKNLKQMSND